LRERRFDPDEGTTVTLPFTSAEFFDVFGAYNRSLWVFVLGLWLYAVAGALVLARSDGRSRFVSSLLAVQWVWAGLAYHAMFFSRINPAAWLFAALFVVQSLLFVWFGVIHQQLRFSPRGSFRHAAAWALIVYGLMYPLIVRIEGHGYPDAPTFGVPCPTTLLTIGFLFTVATCGRGDSRPVVIRCRFGGHSARRPR
jgi:hypothetical protein